jgi:hypothetical protein
MAGKIVAAILSVSLIFAAPSGFAANKDPNRTDRANQSTAQGPRKHLTTIVMAGLAGAILGLSTLSFYGRPQDRLSNVPVGFAFGVIIGAGYATYKAATEPHDFYAKSLEPELWAMSDKSRAGHDLNAIPKPTFVFQF